MLYSLLGVVFVFGLDNSPKGLNFTLQLLGEDGLEADHRLQSMTEKLPYQDCLFDATLSTQGIHRADIATIKGLRNM